VTLKVPPIEYVDTVGLSSGRVEVVAESDRLRIVRGGAGRLDGARGAGVPFGGLPRAGGFPTASSGRR